MKLVRKFQVQANKYDIFLAIKNENFGMATNTHYFSDYKLTLFFFDNNLGC